MTSAGARLAQSVSGRARLRAPSLLGLLRSSSVRHLHLSATPLHTTMSDLLFTIPRNPAVAVGLPLALGFGSGLITRTSVNTWFKTLRKPVGEPPALLFPVAWSALYVGMGYSSHLLVKAYEKQQPGTTGAAELALKLYWSSLALNLAWTPLFFGAKETLAALVDISILTPVTYALTYYAHLADPRTTYFLAPYCAWLTFASYLNAGVWFLNFAPASWRAKFTKDPKPL